MFRIDVPANKERERESCLLLAIVDVDVDVDRLFMINWRFSSVKN